jgi:hypothetical protein
VTVAARDWTLFLLEASFAFGDFVHELLDDEQAGVAADSAAIWGRVSIWL